MTESDVQNIIKKSIYNLIKEGTADNYVSDMWQYLEEALGADELYRYLGSDTIEGFINHMKRHYEIDES